MNRRIFLKIVGAGLIVPTLPIEESTGFTVADLCAFVKTSECTGLIREHTGLVGVALQDIPKDGYGWIQMQPSPFVIELQKRRLITYAE